MIFLTWYDEQPETHRRHCFRKIDESPAPKPRADHPGKVKCTCGQEWVLEEKLRYAFSKESWLLIFMPLFWNSTFYHLFNLNSHLKYLASCKTTIRSIHPACFAIYYFLKLIMSIGGKHHQDHQTWTQLRFVARAKGGFTILSQTSD